MRTIVLVCLLAAGCGKSDRDPQLAGPATTKAATQSGPVKPTPKTREEAKREEAKKPDPVKPIPQSKGQAFREGMQKYIEEARSLARTLEMLPDSASYKRRLEKVQEVFSRVPDPPPFSVRLGDFYEQSKKSFVLLGRMQSQLAAVEELVRLGGQKEAAELAAGIKKGARELKDLFDVMEESLKD